jgi:4-amino-4-deoxy-L-arabinose transferase-like glycosyltransferase
MTGLYHGVLDGKQQPVTIQTRWRILDSLWLLLLAVYMLLGVPGATFHGDEAMQIYMSTDYYTAFVERDLARLQAEPPFQLDDDPWLRILNGSVNRYAIGLSWALVGYTRDQLPPKPGWDWGLSYEVNVDTNHRPDPARLTISRLSSVLFFVLSAGVMFALGAQLSGRPAAYVASALYVLNPILLLNGRRAMQEGSFLLFGLLAVLMAIIISKRRAQDKPDGWGLWLGLLLSSGLALASKHSAVVLVAGAFGWIALAEVARLFNHRRDQSGIVWRSVGLITLRWVGTGLLTIALFIALSPALWNNPPARLADLVSTRQQLLDIQVSVDPRGAMPLEQRLLYILTQPFIEPVAHYEVSFWSDVSTIQAEIAAYMQSPFSGLHAGMLLGTLLTIAALLGLLLLILRWRHWSIGLLAWIGVTILSLLANPLPWQRYYLPWIPILVLLVGYLISVIVTRLRPTPAP